MVVALAGLGFAVVKRLPQCLGDLHDCHDDTHRLRHGIYLKKKSFVPDRVAEVSLLGVALFIAAVVCGRVVASHP